MNNEELEKLVEKSLALAEDNNRMLKKLYKSMRWSRAINILYWVLLVGSVFGAYYFLQPFIDETKNLYGDFANPKGSEVRSFLLKQLEGTKNIESSSTSSL